MVIKEDLLVTFGADIIQLQKSELLFTENDDPAYYFQIKSGKIKLTNFQPDNREFIQSIHAEGDSVGEVFLFAKGGYVANAVVMEDSTLIRLPFIQLLQLLASDFGIQLKFLQYLAERSYQSYLFLNNLTTKDATQQLLSLLIHLKGTENKVPYSYLVPYTRKEIAFLTGLRIETVIRTFKKMEGSQLIKITRGRVYY
jgi:CRP-like cAMP-binding protein